jgi:hypothetical protein
MDEIFLTAAVYAVLFLYPAWRVFKRAGLVPALSVTVFLPHFGVLLAGVLLATMPWRMPVQGARD